MRREGIPAVLRKTDFADKGDLTDEFSIVEKEQEMADPVRSACSDYIRYHYHHPIVPDLLLQYVRVEWDKAGRVPWNRELQEAFFLQGNQYLFD